MDQRFCFFKETAVCNLWQKCASQSGWLPSHNFNPLLLCLCEFVYVRLHAFASNENYPPTHPHTSHPEGFAIKNPIRFTVQQYFHKILQSKLFGVGWGGWGLRWSIRPLATLRNSHISFRAIECTLSIYRFHSTGFLFFKWMNVKLIGCDTSEEGSTRLCLKNYTP